MRLLTIPLLLSVLFACVEDVGKDKVKAEVAEVPAAPPVEEAPPAAPAADVKTFPVDAARSQLQALGAKISATHPIVFKTWKGTVGLTGDTLANVAFEVDMATLEADHPKLTVHLKDADFFDVAKFPTSTFTSTEIKAGSDQAGFTHTVTGDFMIHGVTKRITFPANVTVTPTEVSASTEFVLNRQDFGVTYPGKPDDLVQDNVRMTIQLVAPRT